MTFLNICEILLCIVSFYLIVFVSFILYTHCSIIFIYCAIYYDKYDQCRRVEIVNLVVFKFCVLFIVDGFLWINTGIFQMFLKTYIVAYSKYWRYNDNQVHYLP